MSVPEPGRPAERTDAADTPRNWEVYAINFRATLVQFLIYRKVVCIVIVTLPHLQPLPSRDALAGVNSPCDVRPDSSPRNVWPV